jgi:hypothetical protein
MTKRQQQRQCVQAPGVNFQKRLFLTKSQQLSLINTLRFSSENWGITQSAQNLSRSTPRRAVAAAKVSFIHYSSRKVAELTSTELAKRDNFQESQTMKHAQRRGSSSSSLKLMSCN